MNRCEKRAERKVKEKLRQKTGIDPFQWIPNLEDKTIRFFCIWKGCFLSGDRTTIVLSSRLRIIEMGLWAHQLPTRNFSSSSTQSRNPDGEPNRLNPCFKIRIAFVFLSLQEDGRPRGPVLSPGLGFACSCPGFKSRSNLWFGFVSRYHGFNSTTLCNTQLVTSLNRVSVKFELFHSAYEKWGACELQQVTKFIW